MAPHPTPPTTSGAAVLVPVKAFDQAKLRLAPSLDAHDRAELARRMAGIVVRAAAPLPVWVVCDDHGVASWAGGEGAAVSWQPGRGLNDAVGGAVAERAADGYDRVIVAHGDLPLAEHLAWLAEAGPAEAVLVPDRRDDGTNVLSIPTDVAFRFAYGPGSFARHVAEAERLGLRLRVVRDPSLGWDVDLPVDLPATWPR